MKFQSIVRESYRVYIGSFLDYPVETHSVWRMEDRGHVLYSARVHAGMHRRGMYTYAVPRDTAGLQSNSTGIISQRELRCITKIRAP